MSNAVDDSHITELVHERAAIMHYDGNVKPDEAFKMAFFEVKRIRKLVRMPESLCEELKSVTERILK